MTSQTTHVGRQHLLEVAERLFTEQGYREVSIRDIAQASGVTNAALYYHFPNKEALFTEVLEYHVARLGDRMRQTGQRAETTRGKVVAMLLEYAAHAAKRRSPLFLLRHKPDGSDRDQVRAQHVQLVRAMLQPLEEVLQVAVENGELRSLPDQLSAASLLLGLFHGLVQHRRTCQECEITSNDVELVVDIFWKGMQT